MGTSTDGHESPLEQAREYDNSSSASDTNNAGLTKQNVAKKLTLEPQSQDGATAWLCCLGASMVFASTWGPALSFGVFQAYYQSHFLKDMSPSNISWIGSMTNLFLVCSGIWSGPLFDRGYMKSMLVIGVSLTVLGFMMLSLSTEYYQIMLSHGVCFGLGAGLVQVPLYSTLNVQFGPKIRPIAVGLATIGSSISGTVFPIIFQRLFPSIGFGWTCRTVGFMQLALGSIGVLLLFQAPIKLGKPRSIILWHVFREPAFMTFCFTNFTLFLGYWIPLFYATDYATDKIGTTFDFAVYFISMLNAGSVLGRLCPAFIIPIVGAIPVLWFCSAAAAVLLFGWIGVYTVAGYAVWNVLFGIFTGSFIMAMPVSLAHPVLTPDMSEMGSRLGIVWFASGIGALIGNPVAGTLATPLEGYFLPAQVFAGSLMTGGVMLLIYPMVKGIRHDQSKRRTVQQSKA